MICVSEDGSHSDNLSFLLCDTPEPCCAPAGCSRHYNHHPVHFLMELSMSVLRAEPSVLLCLIGRSHILLHHENTSVRPSLSSCCNPMKVLTPAVSLLVSAASANANLQQHRSEGVHRKPSPVSSHVPQPDYPQGGEDDDLIKPKKLINPVKASKSHQELHRELMSSCKRY